MNRRGALFLAGALILLCLPASATSPPAGAKAPAKPAKFPEPTVADFAYGHDSERQKLDFWQAKSDTPTPLVVLIHGGGWLGGDKSAFRNPQLQRYLDAGVSVAAINYRFIPQAMEQGIKPPVKAPLQDAARAVQTLRSKAKEWNIDPKRLAAFGGSAGACTSLWLALHDDLADLQSSDPISRQSTRLQCVAVQGAQTSLDPQQLRQWIPNAVYGGHAFGYWAPGRQRAEEFELALKNRGEILPWIREYSPIEHVSAGDPPLLLLYSTQDKPAVTGQKETDPTHSAVYGLELQKVYRQHGLEAHVVTPQSPSQAYPFPWTFVIEKLQAK